MVTEFPAVLDHDHILPATPLILGTVSVQADAPVKPTYLATPMPTMKKQGDSLSPVHTSRRSFRRYTLRTLLILAALVGVGNVVVAWLFREPRFPVVQISHPVVSPSGKQIAFIITRGDKRSFDRQHTGRDIDACERLSKTSDVRLSVVSLSDVQTTNTGA